MLYCLVLPKRVSLTCLKVGGEADALFCSHNQDQGDGEILPWVQPTSVNPYRLDDMVTHNGSTWQSTNDANVWEPGVFGWVVIDVGTPVVATAPDEWVTKVDYSIGDEVTYNGIVYVCIQAHTSQANWKPSGTASLWSPV